MAEGGQSDAGDSSRAAGEPPGEAAHVRVEDLRVEYGETTALDGVDLAVAEGEFFTLVGPSGCGKTTTLRCLAGFEEPTAGSVRIAGESMAGVPPEARGVGVVFQSYALFPHMTVGENVAYGLRFSGPPEGTTRSERVTELLELVDLPGFADRDPDTLSGGQQQRVALARALAPEPRLLLLDEPMSALDARLRERLRVQVREIQRELGITTVYVTHDQEEALAVSDRVAVVDGGRVEQVGPPRALYDAPATRFVAEFLGDNNVFTGVVADDGRAAPEPDTPGNGHGAPSLRVENAAGGTAGALPLPVEAGGDLRRGDRLVVCVRPERIRVQAQGSADPGDPEGSGRLRSGRGDAGTDGRAETAASDRTDDWAEAPASDRTDGGTVASLAATVTHTEFLGDTTRIGCEWSGVEMVAQTDGERSFAVGEAVTLAVDGADVRVVERE